MRVRACAALRGGRSGARAAVRHPAARERSLRLDGLPISAAGRVGRSTPPRTDHRRGYAEERRPRSGSPPRTARSARVPDLDAGGLHGPPREPPTGQHRDVGVAGSRALAAAAVSRAERNPSGAESSAAGYRFAGFGRRVARGGERSVGVVGRHALPAAAASGYRAQRGLPASAPRPRRRGSGSRSREAVPCWGRSGARAAGRHAAARERSLRLDALPIRAAGRVGRSTPRRTDHRRGVPKNDARAAAARRARLAPLAFRISTRAASTARRASPRPANIATSGSPGAGRSRRRP